MAKVTVSLPDELVASLDGEAVRKNTSRSGLLHAYVREGLQRRAQERARRVDQIMADRGHHGGAGLANLKRSRPSGR